MFQCDMCPGPPDASDPLPAMDGISTSMPHWHGQRRHEPPPGVENIPPITSSLPPCSLLVLPVTSTRPKESPSCDPFSPYLNLAQSTEGEGRKENRRVGPAANPHARPFLLPCPPPSSERERERDRHTPVRPSPPPPSPVLTSRRQTLLTVPGGAHELIQHRAHLGLCRHPQSARGPGGRAGRVRGRPAHSGLGAIEADAAVASLATNLPAKSVALGLRPAQVQWRPPRLPFLPKRKAGARLGLRRTVMDPPPALAHFKLALQGARARAAWR